MLWAALSLSRPPDETPPSSNALHGLATWALQFTPHVAIADEAVVLEVEASTRLFGGRRALHERMASQADALGVAGLAWAPNSLAALACVRAGVLNGVRQPLPDVLDPLPMQVLSAAAPHRLTLAQLGCRTLGDVRRLPRPGINRRFGQDLLNALDQAYGHRPDTHRWIELPETFQARLALMARVESAPAMLYGARRLLLQLSGWLAARQAGTTALTLRWMHDTVRSRDTRGDALTIRTAQPMRDVDHLHRLLAEHLARTTLQAPVDEIALEVTDIVPLQGHNASLLPETMQDRESLVLALERIAARLGSGRVSRPALCDDHRLDWAQHWQPALHPLPRARVAPPDIPLPTFVLPAPQPLIVRDHRPWYQGPLMLLAGPHRLEGGWWHRTDDDTGTHHQEHDYWIALSEQAGVLWIYQARLAGDATAWYLHGFFA